MAGQHEELSCPFCDKGRIQCLYFPSVLSVKSSGRSSIGSGKYFRESANTWLIQSGCSNCGKSQEEVEKELRKKNII